MANRFRSVAALAFIAVLAAGCTHTQEAPALSGPSDLALSLSLQAIPDSISQDGGSQSSIRATVIGPNGRPVPGVAIRIDTRVNGVPQDYGTLSARTIVTNSDGVATVVYTAPPAPAGGVFGLCGSLVGTCIDVVATPTGSAFETSISQSVMIRLVPTGVILPPANNPKAAFTFTPIPLSYNIPTLFDASSSDPGTGATQIVDYSWSFGDGSTAHGRNVSHTFVSSTGDSTTFTVILTVTNDRGLTNSTTQALAVVPSPAPTGTFTWSPQLPAANQLVLFNAEAVRPAANHTIVSYAWIFGDGATANGKLVSHAFQADGQYNVTLTVTDETGRQLVILGSVTIGGTAARPTANFTFTPSSPVGVGVQVTFDGSLSTVPTGATIVSYQWNFGDGATVTTSSSTVTHTYTATGTNSVSLVVVDSLGRQSQTLSRQIQVQ